MQTLSSDLDPSVEPPLASMERFVAGLADRYPNARLTLGYIGNLTRDGDDRGWRVFMRNEAEPSHGCLSWGDYATEQLGQMLVRAKERLEPWIRSHEPSPASDEAPRAPEARSGSRLTPG